MSLQVKLLGNLQIVRAGGMPSEVMKSQKGCALLAYLIVSGQPQRREFLADLLWEADTTSQSLQNLRKLLSRLRRWLPQLEVTRKEVSYSPETAAAVDYLILTEALDRGSTAEMDAALALYQGDLLDGFYLDDAPRFNEWLLIEREKLRVQATVAYRQICFIHSEQEAWQQGIAAAQRWLALDEFDEDALRHLMQFLAANRQVAVALQQYEMSRQRLWQEIAVEPAPETIQLAQHLQHLKEEKGSGLLWANIVGAQLDRPRPGQLAEPGMLPANAIVPYRRNQDFSGRQASLLRLASLLLPEEAASSGRAVAVTGMAGLGKTQLAVEFCYRYGRFFPGGVFWLSFANGETVADEVAAIGGEDGLGLFRTDERLTQMDRVGRVRRAWQETIPRLLVFDNCETEELLAEWLPVSGGCRLLLTSRRGVWSPDLGVTTHALQRLDRHESIQLLQQLVSEIDDTAADVIASELGDLPLALHLAGSFLHRYRHIAPAAYLSQLQQVGLLQHPSLQGHGVTHSPTGHTLHVARTFALNFEQLDPGDETDKMARQLLACAIALAPGDPIPQTLLLACVQTEPDDLLATLLATDGLTRLLTLGILRQVDEESVQVHRLVATYATAELGALVRVGRTAIENYLLHLLAEQFDRTRFVGQLPFAAVHLQAITQKGLERADDSGTQLALWWGRYLRDVGNPSEAQAILATAVSLRRALFPAGDLVLADLLSVLGTLMWETGAIAAAWPYYEEVVTIRQRILGQHHSLVGQSIQNLALLHSRSGSLAAAQTLFKQALTIYEQLDPPDEQQIALTLGNLALLSRRLNLFAEAEQQFQRAIHIREKLLPPTNPGIAQLLNNLGNLVWQRGDTAAALHYHQRALNIRRASLGENHVTTALSLLNLGIVKSSLRWFDEAEGHLQAALTIRRAQLAADHPLVGQTLNYLGQHCYRANELERAQSALTEALVILAEKRPHDYDTAFAYIYLAYCHLPQQALGAARLCLEKARLIQAENLAADHFFTAYRLLGSGDLALAEGDKGEAQRLYEKAARIFGETAVADHPDWTLFRSRLAIVVQAA